MMRVVHDEPKATGSITLQFGLYGERPEMEARYSKQSLLPNRLVLRYRMNREGEYLEDSWLLSGPRVLSDGRLSQKITLKTDGGFDLRYYDPPDWVKELAEKYRPGRTYVAPNASSDTTLIHT
jgi:hypothetical protein